MQSYHDLVNAQNESNFRSQEQVDKFTHPSEYLRMYIDRLRVNDKSKLGLMKTINRLDIKRLNVSVLEQVISIMTLVPIGDVEDEDWTYEFYLERNKDEIRKMLEDHITSMRLNIIRYLKLVLECYIDIILEEVENKEKYATFQGPLLG